MTTNIELSISCSVELVKSDNIKVISQEVVKEVNINASQVPILNVDTGVDNSLDLSDKKKLSFQL